MTAEVLELEEATTGQRHRVAPQRLIIAGFTGREQSEVDKHVEELRAFGAVAPESTPAFFDLDPGLLTTADAIAVRTALLELTDTQRQAVVCRWYLDLSVAETAAAMDLSPGAVRALTHRATTHLRELLSFSAPTEADDVA